MSFTDDPYVHVEAFIDGAWVDLPTDFDDEDGGGRVSGSAGVTITRGRPAGAQRANPGQCDFTLFNRDGKYSNRNPRSPYYGLLPLNVPVRVKVDPYETFIESHSYAPSAFIFAFDSATLDFTGDMEVRIEYERDDTLDNGFPLICKYDVTGNNRSWFIGITSSGLPQFYWSPDGTVAARRVATSTAAMPTGRKTLRVQFDANNGAGGVTIRFYTADSLDGPFTQLGTDRTFATTSSIYAGTADVTVGASNDGGLGIGGDNSRHFRGRIHGLRLYNNLNGTVTSTGDFSNLEIGNASYSDGTTTWYFQEPAFVGSDSIRFHGLIPRFPIESSSGDKDIRSPITAYDLTQSLSIGATELASAMYRYYSSISTSVGYWSCEDGEQSTQLATPTVGARPALVTGVDFAADSSLAGSSALITLGESSNITGRFAPHTGTGAWAFGFSFYIDQVPAADISYLMTVTTSSGVTLKFTVGTTTYLSEIYAPDGTLSSSNNTLYGTGAEPGKWVTVVFELSQSGANIAWATHWRTLDPSIGYTHGGTAAGLTLGKLASWTVNRIPPASNIGTAAIGHIIGVNNEDVLLESAHLQSFRGYTGETDVARLTRLCAEEGVPLRIRGIDEFNTRMGPQTPKLLLDLLDECADAGRGVLYGRRDSAYLEYITRQELSKYATTTIDYSGGALLNSKVDDTLVPANYITVTRQGGSSSTTIVEEGPNSVATIGRFGDPYTLNLFTDDQTRAIADWIARSTSWDESRWLDLDFELAKPLIADDLPALRRLRALDLMRVILITNPPDYLPVREPEMLIERYSETFTRLSHRLTLDETTPARPLQVTTFLDESLRIDSTSSTLTADVSDSALSFSVSTSSPYGKWKYSSDVYISVSEDKEKMLVTGISGTTSPFTFTVTRGNPAVAHKAGAKVRLWDQKVLGYTFEGV